MAKHQELTRYELELLDMLDHGRGRLIELVLAESADSIPVYEGNPQSRFAADVAAFLGANLDLFLATARENRGLREDEVELIRAGSRRRLKQGVPLQDVLTAFSLSHQTFFRAVIEERQREDPSAEVPLGLTLAAMRYVDAASAEVAATYVRLEQEMLADADRHRSELIGALVGGRWPMTAAREAMAGELRLAADLDYVALVARGPSEAQATALRARLQGTEPGDSWRGAVTGIHGSDLVVIAELGDSGAGALGERVMAALVDELGEIAVGVGSRVTGVDRVVDSHRQAATAAHLADPGRIVNLPAMSLAERMAVLLPAGFPVAELLNKRVVAFVEEDARGGGTLVETILAYYESDLSSPRAAKRLFVHPNTVLYRLRRAGEITGADMRRTEEVAELVASIRLLPISPSAGTAGSQAPDQA